MRKGYPCRHCAKTIVQPASNLLLKNLCSDRTPAIEKCPARLVLPHSCGATESSHISFGCPVFIAYLGRRGVSRGAQVPVHVEAVGLSLSVLARMETLASRLAGHAGAPAFAGRCRRVKLADSKPRRAPNVAVPLLE